MENPIKMVWFGGTPIFGNIHSTIAWALQKKNALKDDNSQKSDG